MRDNFKYISAAIALGIYFCLVGIILYYFNYRNSEKPVHYVEKNSQSIAVSLAGDTRKHLSEKGKKKASSQKPKAKPKKVRNIISPKQTVQKSKKAKKSVKKIKTKTLFSSVKTPRKPTKKAQKKVTKQSERTAAQRVRDSLKKANNKDKGIENRYFASIEKKLRGWPAQANYAGEQISVWLKIYPSGAFEFKVQKRSANNEFNEALIAYLKQLQEIGLGRHSNPKPYQIEVEFEATE